MFTAKDVITNAVNDTMKLLRTRKRGDTATWAELERAAGFTRESPHWTAYDRRFRRDFLNESGIKLFAVNGVGLKLMTHEEQLFDKSRQQRANRQLWRGNKELTALPSRELSDHQRQIKSRRLDVGHNARRVALYTAVLAGKLSRPTSNGIPKRRPVTA